MNNNTSSQSNLKRKTGIFYGWWVVVAVLFCNLIVVGTATFAFSFFIKPLQEQFGWSRGDIMTAFTISFLSMGGGQLVAGRLIDHYGAKVVIFGGGLLIGIGFIIAGFTTAIWHLYIGYILVGIGAAAAGTVPSSLVVSNWFSVKRGLAIGIMSIGVGAGGLVMSPLVGSYLIPAFGWQNAFFALAILSCLIILPLAGLIIKTKPSEIGLIPDGGIVKVKKEKRVIATVSGPGLTTEEALRSRTLWLIAAAYFISSFSFMAILENQVPHFQDIGFPIAAAAGALSAASLGSAFGKFSFGWLSDRIPAKYACIIGLCLQLSGIVILLFIKATSPVAVLWISSILFGVGMGSWLPTMSIMTGRHFGLAHFGTIFGVINMIQTLGASTGPFFGARMYDAIGNYQLAFIICTLSYVISIPAILMIRKPK